MNMRSDIIIFLAAMLLIGCSHQKSSDATTDKDSLSESVPQLKIINRSDTVFISFSPTSDFMYSIPLRYINDEHIPTEEEKASAETSRIELRNERLNSSRRIHFVFDETINGYHVDVMLYPEPEDFTNGMARCHFRSKTHDFYIETGFTWNWKDRVPNFDKVRYKGETYHTKLLFPKSVVQGENPKIDKNDLFFFKDVDFDGEYEILFCESSYHGDYYTSYKVLDKNRAEPMTAKPYTNFVEPYYPSIEGDTTIGVSFDYNNKTITINDPCGCADYYHDVYILNPNSHDRMNPMIYLEGEHTRGSFGDDGQGFVLHEYKNINGIDSVCVHYPTSSIDWDILATYKKLNKDVMLKNIELINTKDEKIRRPLTIRL